jgi:sarcosine oxidase subunit beta
MTPDGLPILGSVDSVDGYILATGLCGQGFMLGPGIARLLTHLVEGCLNPQEQACLENLNLQRAFTSEERLK